MAIWQSILGFMPVSWVISQISVRKRELIVDQRETAVLAKEQDLSDLATLRQHQLQRLRAGGQDCFYIRQDKVWLRFGGSEPYVDVSFYLFNGSVFDLRFKDLEFTGYWNGSPFRQVPRLVNSPVQVTPGQLAQLQFQQPIPAETRDGLKHLVTTNSIVRWHFEIKGTFEIHHSAEIIRFNTGAIVFDEKPALS
jgi:hypothetical protein